MSELGEPCPTCGMFGYEDSVIPDKCTYCDGTEEGHPPTADDVARYWNSEVEDDL